MSSISQTDRDLDGGTRQRNSNSSVKTQGNDRVQEDADAQLALEFGYKPVFKREFGYLATFSFAVSISGLFATTMTTFSYPLSSGGPAGVVWCWLISGAGCMCLACSVAELVSAYPTSGGLYFTISRLAPPEWIPILSWITGWINLLGQIAGVASSEYGSAQMLLAAISMSRNFDYEITANMTVGVMAVLVILGGIVNSLSSYWMEKMTKTYVIFHMCVLASCSIALLVMTEDKHSAEYVFTHVESNTGWSPLGFSFLFGFLSVSWTMTDYDATAHIAEEISEPEKKAPWAISIAMLLTYICGFLFNVVLCFCMGNSSEVLESPVNQPVAHIFLKSLVCLFYSYASHRSYLFAFSRDGLIPFSELWLKINPHTGTPVYSVWITVICCIVINLIGLGSTIAIAGVFDVCAIALDWSYCIPIWCKLFYGKFVPGPWHMGKYSWWINIWALLWTFFVSIIFVLPHIRPTTALNMNYSSAFLILIFGFAWGYWIISGRIYFTGPTTEIRREDSLGPEDKHLSNPKSKQVDV